MYAELRELDRAALRRVADDDEKTGRKLMVRHSVITHALIEAAKRLKATKAAA